MKAYKGTFLKKDNSEREMSFCRIEDIKSDFVASKINGTGAAKTLADESELVWDLEADNFRVFNWGTIQGDIQEFEVEDSLFDG